MRYGALRECRATFLEASSSSLLLLLLVARLPIKRIPERATGPSSSSRQLCCWELSLAAGGGNARSCSSCRPAQLARLGHGEPQLKSHYAEGGRHLGPLQPGSLPNEACLKLTQLVLDVSPQLQLKRLQSSGFLPLNSPTDCIRQLTADWWARRSCAQPQRVSARSTQVSARC